MKKTAVKKTTKKKTAAKKAVAKKAVAKKKKAVVKKAATKKVAAAKTGRQVRIAKKATPATCAHPTTLFEVEFPTTILFWAGVALFFLFVLLMFTSVFN